MSGGISSVVLLQILDRLIQRQLAKRGRASYELFVAVVEPIYQESNNTRVSCFRALRQKFSLHKVFLLPPKAIAELDHDFSHDWADLCKLPEAKVGDDLERLLLSSGTASTRAHLHGALLTRLIVAFAKANRCDAVLWGHSSSCLAAKSLAAVAEGNGGSLPLQYSDGLSSWDMPFYFPLRDLFKPELISYADCLTGLSDLVVGDMPENEQQISIRDTSIQTLLSRYIDSQGEKYPSIMANVVRTSSKLEAPNTIKTTSRCLVCAMPIFDGKSDHTNTVKESSRPLTCFTCHRAVLESKCRED